MKKKSAALWLLLLCIPLIVAAVLFLTLSGETASLTEAILSSSSLGEKSFTEAEDLLFYSQLIESADLIEEAARPQEEYEKIALTLKELTGERRYTLLLSGSPADCLFTDADGALHRIETATAGRLLMTDGLEFVNPGFAFPELTALTGEGETSLLSSQSLLWNYRLADGSSAQRSQKEKEAVRIPLSPGASPQLKFSRTPDWSEVTVKKGDTLLYRDSAENLSSLSYELDGELSVTVQAKWNPSEDKDFSGETTAHFVLLCDAPAEFSISAESAAPGELITILAKNCHTGEITLESSLKGAKTAKVIDYCGEKIVLLPLSLENKPGKYTLTVKGEGQEKSFAFTVSDKEFSNESLSDLDLAKMKAAYEAEEQLFREQMATPSPEALWNGSFSAPIGGEDTWISSRFGAYVLLGNSATGIRHGGLDYVQLPQSFITAVNDGVVVYADRAPYSGNTVIIDHGLGIYSVYSSMETLSVSKGMKVYKSQTLGTLGNTGFAGGNVLHFEIRVLGECVNPFSFLGKEPDFFNLRLTAN